MSDETNAGSQESGNEVPQSQKAPKNPIKAPRKAAKKNSSSKEKSVAEKDTQALNLSQPEDKDISKQDNDVDKKEPKRSNRRRRGKGKSSLGKDSDQSNETETPIEQTISTAPNGADETSGIREKSHSRDQAQNHQHQPKRQHRKPDPEKVAAKAWKIFLAEVSEEGVALIGDNDARELSRRCFRLAEIFIEEQERRN